MYSFIDFYFCNGGDWNENGMMNDSGDWHRRTIYIDGLAVI